VLYDREYSVESTPLHRVILSGNTSQLAAHVQSGVFSLNVSNIIHASASDPKLSL